MLERLRTAPISGLRNQYLKQYAELLEFQQEYDTSTVRMKVYTIAILSEDILSSRTSPEYGYIRDPPSDYITHNVTWARARLMELAEAQPDSLRYYLDEVAQSPYFEDYGPVDGPHIARRFIELLKKMAFPLSEFIAAAPPPPVNEQADVRPILECVLVGSDGTLTAYYGYENRHGSRVRIPFGANNRLTPSGYQGRQTQDFEMPGLVEGRPGRTAFYPGSAFTVTFGSGERVVWKLGRRTATASNASARCPQN